MGQKFAARIATQAMEATVWYLDQLLPDGATGDQYETWLDLILGNLEIEDARGEGK